MRKKYLLATLFSLALFALDAEAAKQNYLDRQSYNNGQIVTSIVRATDFNIMSDINELAQQKYRVFFFKIIDDCAYLMYQKDAGAVQGGYLFCQETLTSRDSIVKKQVNNIIKRFKEELVPVSVTFDATYSLWYHLPDFYEVLDREALSDLDTPFLMLGKTMDELLANLKENASFIPYGLNYCTSQGYTAVVLPSASKRFKDIQIQSIPLEKFNTVVIPENWTAVGADTDGKNIMILLVLL
jgi:hypothetical protein